jgi:hypothetical protein
LYNTVGLLFGHEKQIQVIYFSEMNSPYPKATVWGGLFLFWRHRTWKCCTSFKYSSICEAGERGNMKTNKKA